MFAIGDEAWPGLSKLAEEQGELLQIIGKLMGTRGEEVHWDGRNLTEELLDEMADVRAAIDFVMEVNPFTSDQRIEFAQRWLDKLRLFAQWHRHEDPPPSQVPKLCEHGREGPYTYMPKPPRIGTTQECPGPVTREEALEALE